MMSRRNTLMGLGAVTAAVAGVRTLFAAQAAQPARTYEVTHSDEEWRRLLPGESYYVMRKAGTERPGSSPLNGEHRPGVFNCAGCALPLFSSKAKFESGTGWPSFYQPIAKTAVDESSGGSMMFGTEVHCHRCGGHLGHVFNDGPKPTGLRYCINGVALNFSPIPT